MVLIRYASILGAFGMVAHIVTNILYTEYPLHFDGETEERFGDVRKAFQQNFLDGWEAEGASLAVFVKGQKVVDIWGGYADKHADRKWKQDTLSVVFSSTKAVAALCIAILADRGRLSLPYLDTIITEAIAVDHNLMKNVLEEEEPKFTPGISTGYHAFTFGWLVDQIVRHTDEKQRGIGQFLREEVTEPNGIDFHIGLDLSQEYRVARVSLPRILDAISEIWSDMYMIEQFFHIVTLGKVRHFPLIHFDSLNCKFSRLSKNTPS
uniref:Beta-lactamase domain-containing protein n=1 Tax=Angiostrongylus cantonensis TaxID=6313 RepID=A0A158PAW7_ANGCA